MLGSLARSGGALMSAAAAKSGAAGGSGGDALLPHAASSSASNSGRAKLCHHGDWRSLDDVPGAAIGRSAADGLFAGRGFDKLPTADHELVALGNGAAQADGSARIDGMDATRNGLLARRNAANVIRNYIISTWKHHDSPVAIVGNHSQRLACACA